MKLQGDALIKEKGRIGTYETEITRPSGEVRNILASVQYIKIDSTDAFITAFIDITDRVHAEQQIRSLAYDLTMAEQEERRRISQILHDDLQQRIFAVKMQLSTLQDVHQNNALVAEQVDLKQLDDWLNESISITRNLSIDLSPAVLRGDGLDDALVWLSSQMREQYGLEVSLHTNGVSTRYDDTLRILLFHAVREALFNVVKHAQTHQALIQFEKADGRTRLTVSDGGVGFSPQTITETDGGGLRNLSHRLNLMGCRMQIQSEPGKGTQMIIDIPQKDKKR